MALSSMAKFWISVVVFLLYSHSSVVQCNPINDYHFANVSTTWTIIDEFAPPHAFRFQPSGITIRPILLRQTHGPTFACGFLCSGECTSYLFALFIFSTTYNTSELVQPDTGAPVVVWAANRDDQVGVGATLNLTVAGDLVLRDAAGSTVWTTNTVRKSVVGMELRDDGNLVLLDVGGNVVWQSFDYPTDVLLPGQRLFQGQKLVPTVSSTNWTEQKGTYFFQVDDKGWFAAVESNPPLVYYHESYDVVSSNQTTHVTFLSGSLSFSGHPTEPTDPQTLNPIPQLLKFMQNGRLVVLKWMGDRWTKAADIFIKDAERCYPLDCGRNSVCSTRHQCSCPLQSSSGMEEYFRAINNQQPELGCSEITHLACNAELDQHFIELENVSYFSFMVDMVTANKEACKQACLRRCTCKAALFRYHPNSSTGDCYLPTDLFTLVSTEDQDIFDYDAYNVFIKVQKARPTKRRNRVATIVGATIASFVLLLVVVSGYIMKVRHGREKQEECGIQEECLEQVCGMPTRFSYEDLKAATENFSKKLGEGGFGEVFEGTLGDGSKIAVKYLNDNFTKAKKSFLAEVKSMSSIHHVNLLRLRGFCARKTQLLLVYELMSKGSLDQWIFSTDEEHVLDLECRKKILLGVARGLAYLHHDCRHKIIHFDVKPRNILLDSDFNAKVADFGMARLVGKDETRVMITGNAFGTYGYVAPDWSSFDVTEKVDVYAYGMVVLVTLCGRESIDTSQPKESEHLIDVFQKCWEEGRLLDMVDRSRVDNDTAVLEMMKLASWCLQWEVERRPSMSSVVKVLEGVIPVDESNLDYKFTRNSNQDNVMARHPIDMEQLVPSFLSSLSAQ